MWQIMDMLNAHKKTMVDREDALPGRDGYPFRLARRHYMLGTSMLQASDLDPSVPRAPGSTASAIEGTDAGPLGTATGPIAGLGTATGAIAGPGLTDATQSDGDGRPQLTPWPADSEEIILAGGCFWGIERIAWETPGVYTTAAGYAGGWTPFPTYEEVFSAKTGHAEAVRVIYTGGEKTLKALLEQFWSQHDPTTAMRQGNDVGTEYRSAVYWTDDAQGEVVRESARRYQEALDKAGRGQISTELAPLSEAGDGRFYLAEPEHQQFLAKNPGGYCNHGFNGVACSLA